MDGPDAAVELVLVQHAEKAPDRRDPVLTPAGERQARRTAAFLARERIGRVVASPRRRARETAEVLAAALGLRVELDPRLRERADWGAGPPGQSADEFRREWARATRDRDFVPAGGESSRAAGARLLAALDDLAAAHPGGRVVVVTHGGVTVDLLRSLFGEASVGGPAGCLLQRGVPPCAITRLRRSGATTATYTPLQVASVGHLGAER
jgi:broad specificity phosphatase PhoE